MGNFIRFVACASVVLSSIVAMAQGGAGGGFGGGGFGGNFQGGNQGNIGGPEESSYPPRNIDSGEEGNRWISSTAILTQGDKVEYKLKGVPGQSIFATVRSEVFDPALKLIDSKGKVVAENDDQYEGNQSPLLMYQFKDSGEYKLTVQNYRSSAGGRFNLYMQTFSAMEIGEGANREELKSPDDKPGHGGHLVYFHFKATEGKTYSIRRAHFMTNGANWDLKYRGIIGPTGVKATDYEVYEQDDRNSPLFVAKMKGDFYLVYDSPSRDGNVDARLDVVEVKTIDKTATTKVDLGPTGLRIFKMKVEHGDIVRSILEAPDFVVAQVRCYSIPEKAEDVKHQVGFEVLQPSMTNDRDLYRLFEEKSEVEILVTSSSDQPVSATLIHKMDVPEWKDGTTVTGRIELGQSQFYTISGVKGDIQRMSGTADGFELVFKLMAVGGDVSVFSDSRKHQPSTERQYRENKRYLVIVTSPMGGGSGTYSMKLDSAKPAPLQLGVPVTYEDGPALGTYAVEVEAGVRYQLLYKGTSQGFTFLDDKGDVIGYGHQQFGDQAALYFVPARKGTVRIKVEGGKPDTRFRVDKHILPDLG